MTGIGHMLQAIPVKGHHPGFRAGEEGRKNDQADKEDEQRRKRCLVQKMNPFIDDKMRK